MKTAALSVLLACLALALTVCPASGQGPANVLARVEAVDRVDRLGLPVYAHLLDARGRAYALVVAGEADLVQAGWPFAVLARDPDVAALSLVIERLPGALARARKQVDVLYDDGRRIIVTPTAGQKAELMGMGLAVIRINTPLVWPSAPEGSAASLQARRALTANATVSNLMGQVSQDTVSNLTAMLDGEKPATIGGESYTILTRGTSSGEPIGKANQFVYEQMKAAGLEVSYYSWSSNGLSGSNIVGVKRGATLSNEVVLVTAHLDSMPDPGARAPGADDNASGCVGVMVAANLLKGCTTERTIRFICFGGEEQGLLGSDAYAQSLQAAGETNVTVFNMDMIAYSTLASRELSLHTRLLTDPGYAADLAVATTFQEVVAAYGLTGRLTPVIVSDGDSASDHFSFWQQGYPGLFAFESDNNVTTNYHKPSDLLAGINMVYFTDYVRASLGTVAHLAGIVPVPAKAAGVSVSDGTVKGKVMVSWSPVEDATGYKVLRNTSNDVAAAQLMGATAATNAEDAGVEVNRLYYYWVQATNSYGPGECSDEDSGYDLLGPCIWANGLDGDVPVSRGSNLTLTAEINPDSYAGVNADWWVVVLAGSSWYYLNDLFQWVPEDNALNWRPVYQGPLGDLLGFKVLETTGLAPGSYTCFFAVDLPMNGGLNMEQIWFDYVTVNVQ